MSRPRGQVLCAEFGMGLQFSETERLEKPIARQFLLKMENLAKMRMCLQNGAWTSCSRMCHRKRYHRLLRPRGVLVDPEGLVDREVDWVVEE